jgi:hypothetical protein
MSTPIASDDMAKVEAAIAEAKRRTGRECGGCSLCCRLLEIDDEPEINKPADVWCRHCRPSAGCGIYHRRPSRCRTYACDWLARRGLPDHWFPAVSRMVVHTTTRADGTVMLSIIVDPRYPDSWCREPYFTDICRIASAGLSSTGPDRFETWVIVGERKFLALPHGAIEVREEGVGRRDPPGEPRPVRTHFGRCTLAGAA